MGNRGCLHDADGTIRRQFGRKAWIACALEFQNRHRTIMEPGSYTELFFLDEATALAAGHRPCGTCRKAALRHFKACWKAAMGIPKGETVNLKGVDQALHEERTTGNQWSEKISALPDGVMVLLEPGGSPHLLWQGRFLEWSFDGYRPPIPPQPSGMINVITPKALVQVLRAGYPITVHPSAAV